MQATTTFKPKGKVPDKKGVLTRHERVRLMLETGCDERTIRRWERGDDIKDVTDRRIRNASVDLNIGIPDVRTKKAKTRGATS